MRKKFLFYAICTLGLFSVKTTLGQQETCTEILDRAESVYDAGNIENVELLLEKCINNGFSKEEKLAAYRLIIKSKLYDELIEDANAYMIKFLELDPEYELKSTDPEEFQLLYNEYNTAPMWSWGVQAGYKQIFPTLMKEFGTYNTEEQDYIEFRSEGLSYHFGFRLNRFVANKIEIQADLLYEVTQFRSSYYGSNQEFDSIVNKENQTLISLPISLTYDFYQNKNLRPYARLGVSTSYMINASADISKIYVKESQNNNENVSYDGIIELRKRLQFAVMAGLGVKYKIPRGYVFLEGRYQYGLNNQVNADDRSIRGDESKNYDKMFLTNSVDSDFSLNNASLSIGYTRNIYNPRKKELKE